MSDASAAAPDYGLDAPRVVRNLLLAGATGLLLWGSKALGIWSGQLVAGPIRGITLFFPLARMGLLFGVGCTAMGLWMIWASKVGKIREREQLLNHITWTGQEQVLDVGCGRGLMLIGAAKRLTTGRATGIDIWQAKDLSGNRAAAPLENARKEGVADRVAVRTADMRELPFPDASFDVVVSCAAIHNVPSQAERAKAIAEIVRVLKPGGRALIDDIRNLHAYAAEFKARGCADITWLGSPVAMVFLSIITFGSMTPNVLLVQKPAAQPQRSTA